MTGTRVLVRPARSVWQAQAALTLHAFMLGILLLPASEGLVLALFQLFFWLSVGCLVAHGAAHWTLQGRCRDLYGAEAREAK